MSNRHGQPYTPEEDALILSSNLGYTALARLLGRSRDSVRARQEWIHPHPNLNHDRVSDHDRALIAMRESGKSFVEMAQEFGLSPSGARTAYQRAAKRASRKKKVSSVKPRWHPEDDVRLQALWLDGVALKEIARQLGRPSAAIYHRVSRMDLPPRRAPLTTGDCRKIRAYRQEGKTLDEIAALIGCCTSSVYHVLKAKS